jgi:hypothetical protein
MPRLTFALIAASVAGCWTSAATAPQSPTGPSSDEPARSATAELGSDAVVPTEITPSSTDAAVPARTEPAQPAPRATVAAAHPAAPIGTATPGEPANTAPAQPPPRATVADAQPGAPSGTAPRATAADRPAAASGTTTPPTASTETANASEVDPSFYRPQPDTAAADATTAATSRLPPKPRQPSFYLGARYSFGYGDFEYAGLDDGGFSYPSQSASGVTTGGGVSIGWFLNPQIAVGATVDFDSLVAPRGHDNDSGMDLKAEPVFMPNGTIGGMLAWLPSEQFSTEFAATFGGGGVAGLPGGCGLELHAMGMLAVAHLGAIAWGPVARVTWGPLMVDPVRGGSLQYYSFDLGVMFHMGAARSR